MTTDSPPNGFLLGDKVYNYLKRLVQIILPATSTLYFTLGSIWDLPAVEQVIGTIAAITIFLGVLLGLSTKTYNSNARYSGTIIIGQGETGKLYSLELEDDPESLDDKNEITFKVVKTLPPAINL